VPTVAWTEYRDLLASHVTKDSDSLAIASAFQGFVDINSFVAARDAAAGGMGNATFLGETDAAFIDQALAKANIGGETLLRLLARSGWRSPFVRQSDTESTGNNRT